MRCNIAIKLYLSGEKHQDNFSRPEIYDIPDCEVPPGSYVHGKPKNELDAARVTVHEFAMRFFDPENKKEFDKFEGTDYFSNGSFGSFIFVYMIDGTPPEEIEALVTALAEAFAVPETADAR